MSEQTRPCAAARERSRRSSHPHLPLSVYLIWLRILPGGRLCEVTLSRPCRAPRCLTVTQGCGCTLALGYAFAPRWGSMLSDVAPLRRCESLNQCESVDRHPAKTPCIGDWTPARRDLRCAARLHEYAGLSLAWLGRPFGVSDREFALGLWGRRSGRVPGRVGSSSAANRCAGRRPGSW
jgi:hypothetical protein